MNARAEDCSDFRSKRTAHREPAMKAPNAKPDIFRQIHDILWNDWDPIGVHDFGMDDEYDSYIGGIYQLLSGRSDEQKLLNHLHQLETHAMGLIPRDKAVLVPVVEKLMGIEFGD
jgi:hypothetical protein